MIPIMIIGIIISIGIIIVGIVFVNDWNHDLELAGALIITAGIMLLIFTGAGTISLCNAEGNNKERFMQLQIEYNTIVQYMNSSKSESILESQDLMNRITNYNNQVIQKRVEQERPILKYWAVGADWNELPLIEFKEEK